MPICDGLCIIFPSDLYYTRNKTYNPNNWSQPNHRIEKSQTNVPVRCNSQWWKGRIVLARNTGGVPKQSDLPENMPRKHQNTGYVRVKIFFRCHKFMFFDHSKCTSSSVLTSKGKALIENISFHRFHPSILIRQAPLLFRVCERRKNCLKPREAFGKSSLVPERLTAEEAGKVEAPHEFEMSYWRLSEGSRQSYIRSMREVTLNLYAVWSLGFARSMMSCLSLQIKIKRSSPYILFNWNIKEFQCIRADDIKIQWEDGNAKGQTIAIRLLLWHASQQHGISGPDCTASAHTCTRHQRPVKMHPRNIIQTDIYRRAKRNEYKEMNAGWWSMSFCF